MNFRELVCSLGVICSTDITEKLTVLYILHLPPLLSSDAMNKNPQGLKIRVFAPKVTVGHQSNLFILNDQQMPKWPLMLLNSSETLAVVRLFHHRLIHLRLFPNRSSISVYTISVLVIILKRFQKCRKMTSR